MPFNIVRQDITQMQVDAIVNAANTNLLMGSGVCGAIFHKAGIKELSDACSRLAPINTGHAVMTPGFALKAKYIIHAAGPVYDRNNHADSEKLLRSTYLESLKLAVNNNCTSIAFPLISSGIYGYPKEEALKVAVSAISDFLSSHDMDIYLVIFDKASFVISEKLMGAVESYIDENYVSEHEIYPAERLDMPMSVPVVFPTASMQKAAYSSIDDAVKNLDEPFYMELLRIIDAKGKTDVEVYKSANIDRKLFSKIRSGKGYMPSKRTILALAIALELTLKETDALLERAGYALSHSQKFDVIVEYFIINGIYDIFSINEVLFKYDQPLLGSC